MTGKYDDIINLTRPVSKRPKMPRIDRAAQFSPFAALTGHEEAIKETARLTEKQIELDENHKEEIRQTLNLIAENITQQPEVIVRWYQPDERKSGGAYLQAHARVIRIDDFRGEMSLATGKIIPLKYIVELSLSR